MKKNILVLLVLSLLTVNAFSLPPVGEGKIIFTTRCASCHNVNKVIVGPALAGVTDRHTEDWIIHFVHSPQRVIKSGDTAANNLYERFNKTMMPDHEDLDPNSIKSILAYIQAEAKATPPTTPFRPETIHPNYTPIVFSQYKFFIAYLFLIVLLTGSLLALVRVKEIQRNNSDDQ